MNWPEAFASAVGVATFMGLLVTIIKSGGKSEREYRERISAPAAGWTVTTKTPVSLVDTATLERDLAGILTEIAIAEVPDEDVPETIASELVDRGYQLIKFKKGKTT